LDFVQNDDGNKRYQKTKITSSLARKPCLKIFALSLLCPESEPEK